MKNHIFSLFCSIFQVNVIVTALSAQPCINFRSPVAGSAVTESVCTLFIEENECPRSIKKIEFQARYFPEGTDTAAILSIGSVSRRPYIFLWDISSIPNQLFSGVSLFAEATLSNGDMEAARREGIFFLHRKVERPVLDIPYEFSGVDKVAGEPIRIAAPNSDVVVKAYVYWNEKELVIVAEVSDPHFDSELSKEKFASMGLEILIDPALSRKPFPGKEVFIYSVPLVGKPYRIIYKPVYDDSGAFKFETSTLASDFSVKIKKTSHRGFVIYCPVPMAILGQKIPGSIGLNLVAKTLSEKNEVKRASWIKASLYETYSPFLWGEVRLKPRPILMNRLLVGTIAFCVGFFLTLLVSAIVFLLSRPSSRRGEARSEADRQQFAAIKETLDANVIVRDITLESAAAKLNLSPKKLARIIRRSTGMDFHTYVMYARIEIAKERLRSSHCTLESIVDMCGFHSLSEMEKYFVKFNRITPARFRSENQVV